MTISPHMRKRGNEACDNGLSYYRLSDAGFRLEGDLTGTGCAEPVFAVSSVLYSSGAGYRDSDMDDTGRLAV